MKSDRSLPALRNCILAFSLLTASGSLHADDSFVKLLDILRARGSITQQEFEELKAVSTTEAMAPTPLTHQMRPMEESPEFKEAIDEALNRRLDDKWFEKIKFAGYTQIRYTGILNQDGAELNVPNDGSAADKESLRIRRGRIKFSGDVSERIYLYAQTDFAASVGGSFALQMRDLYGDLYLDKEKVFRLRAGQSKVPFGFVNLQSSQNRPTLERADGINSAAENERDIGAFLYYTPKEVQARFKELKNQGLKHSGNYGMLGIGVYNGQGPNQNDINGDIHTVARATYPFKFSNGQFLEIGVQGYHGQYRVSAADPDGAGPLSAPFAAAEGTVDQRVGGSIIFYPQPWGFEAEWNVGNGPKLTSDFSRVESDFLHGGYLMAYYQTESAFGRFFPFARWNYYDGGRKFAVNAPGALVNELDFGLEWSPWPSVEFVIQYTKTLERTNTRVFPFASTTNADRLGLQLQFNY